MNEIHKTLEKSRKMLDLARKVKDKVVKPMAEHMDEGELKEAQQARREQTDSEQ